MAAARARLRIDDDALTGAVGVQTACEVAFCGPYVVRRPIEPYHRLRFGHEVALLRALERVALPAATPLLVWHDLEPPVMVYRRIAGTASLVPFRDSAAMPPGDTLLFACGYFLGHLHRLEPERDGVPWLPAIESDMLGYLAGVLAAAALPDDIRAFGEAAFARWRTLSGRTRRPCVVHNDFNWKNLILTGDESRLAGVIDWSMSGIADPHLDLGYVGCWGPERFAAIAAGYQAVHGQMLDPRAADAAVRLRLLAAILHAGPDERPATIAAARAHVPLA